MSHANLNIVNTINNDINNNINNNFNTKTNKEKHKRKRKTLKTSKINDFQLKNNLKKSLESKANDNIKINEKNNNLIVNNDNNNNINSNKDVLIYTSKFSDLNINEKDKEKSNNNNEEVLSNYELNNLEYEDSIKKDNRTFLQIYLSILRREHLILFTFFSWNDYNILAVKFTRFIFLVCTDMALNVFFFSDDSMNKIFLTYGKYDFFQKIPQMVYSVLVSQLLEVFLCFLSLTDKYIYQIKRLKNKTSQTVDNIFRVIKIKLCIFFIVTILLFIFYWYLIAAFCAVYVNTQLAFIKDSISSFILGLLYPFILYLFPVLLRIISLRASKANLSCLYSLSDVIPFF